MKQILIFLVGILILFFAGFFWWQTSLKPVSSDRQFYDFVITKGSGASQIGNKLKDQGLISNALAFKFYIQLTGQAKKIQAGEYRLSPSSSLLETIALLFKGPVEVWVTLPEGLRREEVVEKFVAGFDLTDEEAIPFRQEFLALTRNQEGFLFPDTYLFPKTASPSAVVRVLTNTFEKRVDSQMRADIQNGDLNLNQTIALASIIERETITDQERSVVAGILLKRLANDWPLQADATIQYQVGNQDRGWWPVLTKEDIEINSFYNSYKFSGLPPTPIANPGLASIKAAIYPEDSAYWFYLHDPQGQIHYAKTLEEHNQNISRYLGK